jgi:membrane-associated phospholipid phosphatase
MNELRVARIISAAAHPFVLSPLTIALATGNLRWTAILAAVTLLPMTAVILWNVRRGVWSDFDVSRQDQRSGLYWVAIPLLLLTAYLIDAPPQFKRGMFAVAVILLIGLAGNRFLKTSMHMMFAAYSTVILARVYPWSLAVMLPICAALAWSRLRLQRHTPAEIAAGVLLGAAAGLYVIVA